MARQGLAGPPLRPNCWRPNVPAQGKIIMSADNGLWCLEYGDALLFSKLTSLVSLAHTVFQMALNHKGSMAGRRHLTIGAQLGCPFRRDPPLPLSFVDPAQMAALSGQITGNLLVLAPET